MSQPPRILSYRLPMMSGSDVVEVQRRLVAHGFGTEVDTDGLYGPGTRDRLREFQRARGLEVDGAVGPDTLRALRAAPPPLVAAPAGAGTGLLPPDWLPQCRMRRIITHWTGGAHAPSELDRKHYHILIDGDGGVHRGRRSIADNVSTGDGTYAAHTRGCNTGSIGVSVCAMAGASERPFNPGPAPMTERQWNRLAEVVAELCRAYGIACTPLTVLAHGEVQENLGIAQFGKWDPLVLPWSPELSKREVGNLFRARVEAVLAGTAPEDGEREALPEEPVLIDGNRVRGTRFDGRVWVAVEDIAAGDAAAATTEDGTALVDQPPVAVPTTTLGDADGAPRAWVDLSDLSEATGRTIDVAEDGTVRVGRAVASGGRRPVTVARGDTLQGIARRLLGGAARWTEITDAEGTPFDAASARALRVGQVVLLPGDAAETPLATDPAHALGLDDGAIRRCADAVASLAPAWLRDAERKTVRTSAKAILEAARELGAADPSHLAYMLATAEHESNLGRNMVEKWGPSPAQSRYETNPLNDRPGDGRRFLGRGFVQITFRSNYAKYTEILRRQGLDVDLVARPDDAEKHDVAARILVTGMTRTGFTSPNRLLSAYGFDGEFDFYRARDIVNGDKTRPSSRYGGKRTGVGIAEQATEYRQALLDAHGAVA